MGGEMFATAVRLMAKKPKPKMKPIELNTSPEKTQTISRAIFEVVKEHGPLTIAETWDHVKVFLSSFYFFGDGLMICKSTYFSFNQQLLRELV